MVPGPQQAKAAVRRRHDWHGTVAVGDQYVVAHADCVHQRWFINVVLPFSGRKVNLRQMKRVREDLTCLLSPIQDVRFMSREDRHAKSRP